MQRELKNIGGCFDFWGGIELSLKLTIAVILNECEGSNSKSRNIFLVSQPFKLDSSHSLRMTEMA